MQSKKHNGFGAPGSWASILCPVLTLLACSAEPDSAPSGSAGQPTTVPTVPLEGVPAECQTGIVAGRAPMRRLTRQEYNNTVADLLGTRLRAANGFAPEQAVDGFLNNGDAVFFEERVADDYLKAAEALAADAKARGLFDLACAATGRSCAADFIQTLGRKAFRRSLQPAEVESYLTLFDQGVVAEAGSFQGGLEWVLQRMLQSVNFLYRIEPLPVAVAGATAPLPTELSNHSIATRLSYFLWQTLPDDALLDAADQGQLNTAALVEAQTKRMMEDPRFQRTLSGFHRQWVTYGFLDTKLKPIEPAWDGELTTDLNLEADLFVSELFATGGTFADLFTAKFSMLTPRLAQFYGVPAPVGEGHQRVDGLPNRAGLLTMASFLGTHATPNQSNPVKRGKAVRERLLCQPLAPPPNNVQITIPIVTPGVTTRQRFTEHRANPACAGCHLLIDPVGLGFENYDEFGRYRTMDEGQPVDASGDLTNVTLPEGEPTTFNGVEELGAKLSRTAEAPLCMSQQWFRYAMGRGQEPPDSCAVSRMLARTQASNWQLSDVIMSLVTSDVFRHRSVEVGQ